MKYSKPFLIGFMLLNFVQFQNCTDKCGGYCKEIKVINADARSWFTFKVGSKWIYRLSEDTTIFDTLICDFIDSNRSNLYPCGDSPFAMDCSQILSINFVHSNKMKFSLPYDSSKKAYITILTYLRDPESTIFDISFESGEVHAGGKFLGLPIKRGEDYGAYSLKMIDLNLQNDNISFDSVVYSEVNYKGNKNFVDKFWLKKNVGIVKYWVNNGQTWELINYKLNP